VKWLNRYLAGAISHTEEPRQIERRILASVTSKIRTSIRAFDGGFRKKSQKLQDALRNGLARFPFRGISAFGWAFKADFAERDNGLTADLARSFC